eukprot:TRINITY_DN37518_c0_g1_i1.p1 TRINITY_DN37518_c0_g1~~TRINITY_DN37518_c0_g1_i1.p1  ORF type:complete len:421 (+),score=72.34 TRINITY_DN37518_c0_g1_i1:91-1353(+)
MLPFGQLPVRTETLVKLASLECDELGPQVRCCPYPAPSPARDHVLQDPQLLMTVVSAAGLPTARACRACRRALGRDLSKAIPVLYANALPSIYVLGGACRNLGVLSSVKRLDAGGKAWEIAPSMPSARRLCTATACNGSLYVFGGETVNVLTGSGFVPNALNNIDGILRDYVQLSTAERFEPLQGAWEVLPPMPTARAGCAAAAADGLIYVCGGRSGETVLSVVERFDTAVDRWERIPRLPTARSGCAASVVKNQIYVMGGKCITGRVQGTAERFHPTFGRWEKISSMLCPRSAFATGSIAEVIYVAGGFNGSTALASVELFDPALGFWEWQAPMAAPRVGGAAAVTGGRIYVFGGKSSEDMALAGESFDPREGSWAKVPAMSERQVYCAGAAAVSGSSPFAEDLNQELRKLASRRARAN